MEQAELQHLLDALRTLIRQHDWNYGFSQNRKHVMKGMAVEKLIYEKPQLLAPLLPGMEAPPHPMVPGATAKDYYEDRVTGADEPLKDPIEGSAS